MRGTASLVVGMMADTMFMNTVNDNRIVTSEIRKIHTVRKYKKIC